MISQLFYSSVEVKDNQSQIKTRGLFTFREFELCRTKSRNLLHNEKI